MGLFYLILRGKEMEVIRVFLEMMMWELSFKGGLRVSGLEIGRVVFEGKVIYIGLSEIIRIS